MKMCKIVNGSSPQATKLSRDFAAASIYFNYSKSEMIRVRTSKYPTDDHGLHGWNWQVKTY
ncbi:hypothetical protein C2S51_015684 [Perilla frutescens var. frutescens]|nr:hypothetical protein C2S51_015684 [Perilla frutescens var. frutescens]